MASSIRCEPDSAPIQTSVQPACLQRATVSRVIRSQRDCILNGICAPSSSLVGELACPTGKREDIVGEPDMVGRGRFVQVSISSATRSRRTRMVLLP